MSFDVRSNAVEESAEYKALIAASEAFENRFPGEYNAITDRERELVDWAIDGASRDGFDRGYEAAFENEEFVSVDELTNEFKNILWERERAAVSGLEYDAFTEVESLFRQKGWVN